MEIKFGNGTTEYGPGVTIDLTGEDVANAIEAYLVAHGYHIRGARTITVNGELIEVGSVYVDPGAFVVTPYGSRWVGRGYVDVGYIDVHVEGNDDVK